MSVKIMSAVFESETLGPTERLIMLALADHADDDGRCYPSIGRLCRRTGLKDRSIQNNLKSLSDQGYIQVVHNAGKAGANLYFVSARPGTFTNAQFKAPVRNESGGSKTGKRPEPTVNRFTIFGRDNYTCVYCGFQDTKDGSDAGLALHVDHAVPLSRGGSNDADNLCTACVRCNLMKGSMTADEFKNDPRTKCPPNEMHPAFGDIKPPHLTANTPAADAPKPSRTIIEPSESNDARNALITVLTEETADAFIEHRKAKLSKLTVRAAQLIAKDLTHHPNPDAVVEASIKNGWTGVFPEKFGSNHARQSPQQDRQSAADDRFGRLIDAAVRNRAPSRPDFGFS